MSSIRFELAPCPAEQTAQLRRTLGVSDALAQVLVRRGYADPLAAEAFLAAQERHPPTALTGIEQAVSTIRRQIDQGGRITVHGDYDVDGVCATALLLSTLRALRASVDWHIPLRADGYGLREDTVRQLAARGTRLLITVDCGVTAVQEVALAKSLGIETVITDHHAPRQDGALPQAHLLHPALCGYPCRDLCGAAVAHKLCLALWADAGEDPATLRCDLDLVALATVADVMALTGENRTLVRDGLRELAATRRPGLQALIEVSGLDPARIDERAVGFALAPRINAAGRMNSAAAALELLLTSDADRARALAIELDRCNRERREVEQRILIDAEAQVRELGQRTGYVLAGEGWHHGVVGIVASRLAERHHRPFVLVSLQGETGRGSARSIPRYDLLCGITACAQHLTRCGGHRAAAGLELRRDQIEAFRAAFDAHAAAALSAEDLTACERVDAVIGGSAIGMALAEELRLLAPFGRGNPSVCLMVADAQIAQVRSMGQGKHVRFQVLSEGAHANAVAFGVGGRLPVPEGVPVRATFKLEVNEWRGVSEPRLVLRQIAAQSSATPPGGPAPPREPASGDRAHAPAQPLQMALSLP